MLTVNNNVLAFSIRKGFYCRGEAVLYNGVQLGSWFDGPLVSLSLPIYESTQPSTSQQIVRPHNDSSGIFAYPMFFNFSFLAHVSSHI